MLVFVEVEGIDVHADRIGAKGWIAPLKVLVADAKRRLADIAKLTEANMGGLVMGSSGVG